MPAPVSPQNLFQRSARQKLLRCSLLPIPCAPRSLQELRGRLSRNPDRACACFSAACPPKKGKRERGNRGDATQRRFWVCVSVRFRYMSDRAGRTVARDPPNTKAEAHCSMGGAIERSQELHPCCFSTRQPGRKRVTSQQE